MRKKKTDPRIFIALAIVLALAVLVGIAVVLQKKGAEPEVPRFFPSREEPGELKPGNRIVSKIAFPDLLIRGCLFNLGISKEDVRFQGKTVRVSLRKPPEQDRLKKAFAPLEEAGEVRFEGAGHIRVIINKAAWDIFFQVITEKLARCAIIVDDMGQNMQAAHELGRIDADLTFAVLPGLPDSAGAAQFLRSRGREILLHLPMQGNGKNPGPGAILEGMSPDQVRSILSEDLQAIPDIAGVNNHMGSVITANDGNMRLVLEAIKQEDLFFVDSLTTPKSVCGGLAHELDVPFIARDVFLDNELSDAYITAQIRKLVKIALRHSSAVAICHPHPQTIAVLKREIPKIHRQGVKIVKVSSLVEKTGAK